METYHAQAKALAPCARLNRSELNVPITNQLSQDAIVPVFDAARSQGQSLSVVKMNWLSSSASALLLVKPADWGNAIKNML